MGILYPFAEGADGRVVNVESVDRNASPRPRFTCLSCRKTMVARFCRDKRNHFAHLSDPAGTCSAEGYFHQLAKRTFVEKFDACVAAGEPYLLVRSLPITCRHYEEAFGYTCNHKQAQSTDLTRYFNRAALEVEHDGYRADVLLTSDSRADVLFVECAVTHFCEPEKIAKGHRILEITIRNEQDALSLGQARIDDSVLDIHAHNFKERTRSGDVCKGACEKPLSVFRVYASGKAALFSKSPKEYRAFRQRSMIFERVIPPAPVAVDHMLFRGEDEFEYYEEDQPELFKELVREAAAKGVAVKNCYLCRYHGADGIDAAIFCKLMKEPTPSNSAGECGHYRPVSARELAQIDRKNAEYQERTYLNRTINRITRGPFGNLF